MSDPRLLVLATQNRDKVTEMRELFASLPVRIVPAAEVVGDLEVVEDGATLEANAVKKAREIAFACDELCIADDTGLEVDALSGAPGVYSARYAGENVSYEDNWRKLLRELEGVAEAQRTAQFRTVMAMVDPIGAGGPVERSVDGMLKGRILEGPRGDGGFGYDPVFYLPDADRTLAELGLEHKNRISHRGIAGQKMRAVLATYLASTV